MIDIAKLKVGDKVYYQPSHFPSDKWENGMVKAILDYTNTAIRSSRSYRGNIIYCNATGVCK